MSLPHRCLTALLALGALLLPTLASASLYKCKDASGNVAYSDKPCPASGEQESIRIAADSTEQFLNRIASIAKTASTSNPEAVQRALIITMQEGGRARYFWTNPNPSPGLPATRISLNADGEKNGRGVLKINFSNHLFCISPATVNRAFQPSFDMASPRVTGESDVNDYQQRYFYDLAIPGKSRLTLAVRYVVRHTRKSRETCVEQIELQQNQ